MSTRASIAYKTPTGWTGVYSHYDGYPSGLGKNIWDVIQKKFINNRGDAGISNRVSASKAIQAFIDVYIKGHRGGWSVFDSTCYCHSPEFVLRDGARDATIDEKENDPLYIEYVYILDPEKEEMTILTSFDAGSERKDTGAPPEEGPIGKNEWGVIHEYGHCAYGHRLLGVVKLTQALEPDWNALEGLDGKS